MKKSRNPTKIVVPLRYDSSLGYSSIKHKQQVTQNSYIRYLDEQDFQLYEGIQIMLEVGIYLSKDFEVLEQDSGILSNVLHGGFSAMKTAVSLYYGDYVDAVLSSTNGIAVFVAQNTDILSFENPYAKCLAQTALAALGAAVTMNSVGMITNGIFTALRCAIKEYDSQSPYIKLIDLVDAAIDLSNIAKNYSYEINNGVLWNARCLSLYNESEKFITDLYALRRMFDKSHEVKSYINDTQVNDTFPVIAPETTHFTCDKVDVLYV